MEGTVTSFGPTHFRWRPDIKRLVKRYERRYPTKANNYEGHTGRAELEPSSVDFWAPDGRGVPIAPEVGLKIMQRVIRQHAKRPYRYVIYRGYLHLPSGAVQPYWDASDQHFDHVHVTFV